MDEPCEDFLAGARFANDEDSAIARRDAACELGETHRGRLPRLSEFLAQIPDPLGKDLPGFLTRGRVGTPPITVLLTVLISQHGLEAAAMQVELDHIGGAAARVPVVVDGVTPAEAFEYMTAEPATHELSGILDARRVDAVT